MERSWKYKAFISYSHRDRKWARWLHREIEGYRTPRRLVGQRTPTGQVPARLTPVFRDRDDLASAPDLSAQIRDTLEVSENLIVLCSPSAAASDYVNQEIETFKRLGRSSNVFCLIVDGDPKARGTDRDCFPPALRRPFDEKGQPLPGETEPIAADAQEDADGRSLARLKIIAGLLGVGLDELRQRELQRRLRRMAVATVVSLAALAVTLVLAVAAHLARQEADQRRAQAEDLLGFMVGDLRDSLEPIGRLDLLEKVGAKAMDYFATVKVADLSDDELTRHALVLTQIGEIRVKEHQYADALQSFMDAHDRSAELFRNDPEDGERLFNRGQAEFWVGYVYWRQGALDEARGWLTRYLETSQQLAAMDPGRHDWAVEVVYGHHNLAVLAIDAKDLDAAREGFIREIQSLRALQDREPGFDVRRDIADANSWLGNLAWSRGQLGEALEHYQQTVALYEALLADRPDDRSLRYSWAHATHLAVVVGSVAGDRGQAARLAEETMAVLDALVRHDPQNVEWLRSSAKPRIARANLYASEGRWGSARELAREAVLTLQGIADQGAFDLNVHEALADAYLVTAWIAQASANPAAAADAVAKAQHNLETIAEQGPLSEERAGRVAEALVLEGELEAAAGRATAARRAWERALEAVHPLRPASGSPQVQDPVYRALALSGDTVAATQVRARLEESGYAPLRPWPDPGSQASAGNRGAE